MTSTAQAAALVFASDPRWAAIVPQRFDVVGASLWYEASQTADGYSVVITAGAGDCIAGCIERRTWTYQVDAQGSVSLVSEEGDDVEVEPINGGDAPARISVTLSAGPVCPVEQVPPDPNCAPRPVVNAGVTLFDANGVEIDSAPSDDQGVVVFEVPAGAYYVVADDVSGLMGTPEPQGLAVVGGDSVDLMMGYDTGIR